MDEGKSGGGGESTAGGGDGGGGDGSGGGGTVATTEAFDQMMADSRAEQFAMAKRAMLVQRLVGFAFRVLNVDMDGFFTRNYRTFEQDVGELRSGAGETLEQWDVFKEYERELEVHMDKFCKQEGFAGPAQAFGAISEAVQMDLLHHDKQRKAIEDQWATQMRSYSRVKNGGDGGDGDDKENEGKGGEGGAGGGDDGKDSSGERRIAAPAPQAPMQFFFQPITLEQLVNTVTSLGEYQTFSSMMRMKVQQMKAIRAIREKYKRRQGDKRRREDQLRDRELGALFEELCTRFSDLTPHRPDLQEVNRTSMDVASFTTMLRSNSVEEVREDMGKLVKFVYSARLSQLTSPIRCDAVRQDLTDLETALQQGGGEGGLGVEGIAHQLLSGAHTHVDNIEDDIHKYLTGNKPGAGEEMDGEDDDEEAAEGGGKVGEGGGGGEGKSGGGGGAAPQADANRFSGK